jgi:enamine deaminase RidA (YjgF/YER057c/UK114 family)
MTSSIRLRVEQLGLTLPPPPSPRGIYSSLVIHQDVAYVSGQVSRVDDITIMGPVDDQTSSDTITAAAQACVLRALSILAEAESHVIRVERILFLRGFIKAVPAFKNHSLVLDEASTLLHRIFGERGQHARSAIGVNSLPSGGLMEIELTVALSPAPHLSPTLFEH